MTSEDQALDLQAVEDEIRRCVGLCKAQDIRIVPHDLGFHEIGALRTRPTHVCLLGAVAYVHAWGKPVSKRAAQLSWYYFAAMRLGGLLADNQTLLIQGFDGKPSIGDGDPAYYAMGQRLRAAFIEEV